MNEVLQNHGGNIHHILHMNNGWFDEEKFSVKNTGV